MGSNFPHIFKEYNWEFRLDIVSLLEPRISGSKADAVIAKLGLPHSHQVEAVGYFFFGGIWIGWKDSVKVEIIHNNPQFILTPFSVLVEVKVCQLLLFMGVRTRLSVNFSEKV